MMFRTPATRRRTPAKTHQPLRVLSSFMGNPFVTPKLDGDRGVEVLGARSRPGRGFLRLAFLLLSLAIPPFD
jgi:hypothetical protein